MIATCYIRFLSMLVAKRHGSLIMYCQEKAELSGIHDPDLEYHQLYAFRNAKKHKASTNKGCLQSFHLIQEFVQ